MAMAFPNIPNPPLFDSDGAAGVDFFRHLQQSMLTFQQQLAVLTQRVVTLEQAPSTATSAPLKTVTSLAFTNTLRSSNDLHNAELSTVSTDNPDKNLLTPADCNSHNQSKVDSISASASADNTNLTMKEIIRLDGRIDLLNGKVNLIKHDVNQLHIKQQTQFQFHQQQQADFGINSYGGHHQGSSWDQIHPYPLTKVELHGPSPIKAEPEVLLNEYDAGEDGFLGLDLDRPEGGGNGDGNDNSEGFLDDGFDIDDTENDPDYKYGGDIKPTRKKSGTGTPTFPGHSTGGASYDLVSAVSKNANGKFQCPSCSTECKTKKDLVRHYHKHAGQQSFRCHLCQAVFNRKDNWTAHIKKKHGASTSVWNAGIGNISFGSQSQQWSETSAGDNHSSGPTPILSKTMLDSIERNPTSNKFPCPNSNCNKEFCHKRDIKRHYIIVHYLEGDQPLNTGVNQRQLLRQSPESADLLPKGSKQCPICQKTFTRRHHAIRHLKTHSEPKFKCVACEKSYSRSDKLRTHQREKHGQVYNNEDNPFVVDLDREAEQTAEGGCKEDTPKTKATLADKKDKALQIHECPDCKKSFSQKSRLDRHLVGCRGLKPFSCEECLKCFTQKSALLQHRAAIHQGIKRFLCSECGSCFYGSTNYKKHVRSHTGVKPYPCSVCGRHFNGRSDLKRHERIHSGVRNFHCTLCHLKFIRRDALTKHMLVHTGEKPWMCDLCGANFSQSGSMKKHRDICSARVNEGRPPMPVIARKPRAVKVPLGLRKAEEEATNLQSLSLSSITTPQQQQLPPGHSQQSQYFCQLQPQSTTVNSESSNQSMSSVSANSRASSSFVGQGPGPSTSTAVPPFFQNTRFNSGF